LQPPRPTGLNASSHPPSFNRQYIARAGPATKSTPVAAFTP
jgi:hypothetical protein